MDNQSILRRIADIVDRYIDGIRSELSQRWTAWPLNLSESEKYEAIGGLLARLVTLSTQLASSPMMWNGHVAPLVLRSMTDAYITLAWIFGDPLARSRQYIEYGLGQEKLSIEHLKAELGESESDAAMERFIDARERWLRGQKYPFLVEVNVGSWSGLNTREMADEAGCADLYRYAYLPFSATTHSMWNHVGKYNLRICQNPLHRYHAIPVDPDLGIEPDYLYRAGKYVQKGFDLFDEKTGVSIEASSTFSVLCADLRRLGEEAKTTKSREDNEDVSNLGESHSEQ